MDGNREFHTVGTPAVQSICFLATNAMCDMPFVVILHIMYSQNPSKKHNKMPITAHCMERTVHVNRHLTMHATYSMYLCPTSLKA